MLESFKSDRFEMPPLKTTLMMLIISHQIIFYIRLYNVFFLISRCEIVLDKFKKKINF